MIALKRSYLILLIGAGTLVAGSIVFGVNTSTLATDFLSNNMIIKKATIAPGEEYTTTFEPQTSGTVSVLMRGQPFENQIRASITEEDGSVVWKATFNGDHIGNFNAQDGETYKIILTNAAKNEVAVDSIIGKVPFLGINNDGNLGTVVGTFSGIGVGISGIIILIVGAVLFFVDRRPKKIAAAN